MTSRNTSFLRYLMFSDRHDTALVTVIGGRTAPMSSLWPSWVMYLWEARRDRKKTQPSMNTWVRRITAREWNQKEIAVCLNHVREINVNTTWMLSFDVSRNIRKRTHSKSQLMFKSSRRVHESGVVVRGESVQTGRRRHLLDRRPILPASPPTRSRRENTRFCDSSSWGRANWQRWWPSWAPAPDPVLTYGPLGLCTYCWIKSADSTGLPKHLQLVNKRTTPLTKYKNIIIISIMMASMGCGFETRLTLAGFCCLLSEDNQSPSVRP